MTDRIYLARTACCVAVFALVWHAQWAWSKPNNAESHLAVDAPLPEDGPPGGAPPPGPHPPGEFAESSSQVESEGPIQSQPVQRGFVILDGRYLPPPYTVQWSEDGLRLNGNLVPFENRAAIARWAKSKKGLPPPPHRSPWRMVAALEHQLRNDSLVLGLDEETATVLPPREAVRILEILTSEQSTDVKVETLVASGYTQFSSGQWVNVVEHFEPTPELVERVVALKDWLDSHKSQIAATTTTASPAITASVLTALSIALTVVALGTLLTYRPNARQGWRGCNPSRTGCRLVVRCILLLVLLNAFDLGCTLLAVQAGGFWELNPVAERLVSSVGHMVVFKTSLIAAGAAILFIFRTYRFTQNAAWWVCIFHMVLMLRWATYNSLFLT